MKLIPNLPEYLYQKYKHNAYHNDLAAARYEFDRSLILLRAVRISIKITLQDF